LLCLDKLKTFYLESEF